MRFCSRQSEYFLLFFVRFKTRGERELRIREKKRLFFFGNVDKFVTFPFSSVKDQASFTPVLNIYGEGYISIKISGEGTAHSYTVFSYFNKLLLSLHCNKYHKESLRVKG